jgi:predicted AAA+ superfamily ATPase
MAVRISIHAQGFKTKHGLYNIKFIISSSSAIHLQRRSKESLVGRIFETLLLPLSFRDFMALSGKKDIAE